jgi:hypothetical protein
MRSPAVSSVRKKGKIQMDFNTDKYFVEDSHALAEAEKVQFARDLIELERLGVLEYRDGRWELAAGVEIEETSDGPVARFSNKKKEATDGDRR